jgi:hypothetical protein
MSPVMVLGMVVGALVTLMALGIFVSKTKMDLMSGSLTRESESAHSSRRATSRR